MNLNLYCCDGKWLIVDLGISFSDHLGVDIVMPDISFLEDKLNDVVGLVLTHGHEDHIGAIPYLWDKLRCPMYATPFTAEVIRNKIKETSFKNASITEIPLCGRINLKPFDIEFITLTHSIPEPNALAIRTPYGTVMH
ncbi:MAG: ribonuclease J, partial [Alphaproteobacteria bacterium]|nr:ribonuclease J [Alphaproteobacteria bacterium]